MDAAREGHADIASMLREAGASDVTLAAESAPVHKVQLRPSPSRPRAHSVITACAGRCVCQGCWGRLRQRGLRVAAAQQAQGLNTTTLFESESLRPREGQFTFYIIVSQKYFIPSVLRYVFAQHFISVNRSGPAPTH
jgi:hypothetical protein